MDTFNKKELTAYIKRHLVMDIFRPSEHPRAKNGEFVEAGGGAGSRVSTEEYRKKPMTERCSGIYDRHKKNIDNAKDSAELAKVIREATQDVYGSVQRDFAGHGESNISVGSLLAGHLRSYFSGQHALKGEQAKETAHRILFGLSKLPDILKNGKVVSKNGNGNKGWNHNPNHNADKEFLTLMGEYEFQGKKRKFVVDVRRKHGTEDPKSAYHINAEGNRSFESKKNSLILDAIPQMEVTSIRCI